MIEIDSDLRDIVISAFGYIKEHKEIVDKRVKDVLLRDLENLDMYYPKNDIDYEIFKEFEKWLNRLEVE